MTLTGTNIYSGGTTISAGILQLGKGGTTGSIVGNVLDGGTLAFNRSEPAEARAPITPIALRSKAPPAEARMEAISTLWLQQATIGKRGI